MGSNRLQDLERFYFALDRLRLHLGGDRLLATSDAGMPFPRRGVYFFFERGEERRESSSGLRVVRVGTHALKDRSRTTLRQRLSQHRGIRKTGGGNHRGSVFRKHVGAAVLNRSPDLNCPTWGLGSRSTRRSCDRQPAFIRGRSCRSGALSLEVHNIDRRTNLIQIGLHNPQLAPQPYKVRFERLESFGI